MPSTDEPWDVPDEAEPLDDALWVELVKAVLGIVLVTGIVVEVPLMTVAEEVVIVKEAGIACTLSLLFSVTLGARLGARVGDAAGALTTVAEEPFTDAEDAGESGSALPGEGDEEVPLPLEDAGVVEGAGLPFSPPWAEVEEVLPADEAGMGWAFPLACAEAESCDATSWLVAGEGDDAAGDEDGAAAGAEDGAAAGDEDGAAAGDEDGNVAGDEDGEGLLVVVVPEDGDSAAGGVASEEVVDVDETVEEAVGLADVLDEVGVVEGATELSLELSVVAEEEEEVSDALALVSFALRNTITGAMNESVKAQPEAVKSTQWCL